MTAGRDRQAPSAIGIGRDHVDTVRDQSASDTRVAGSAHAAARPVMEDGAVELTCGGSEASGIGENGGAACKDHRVTTCHAVPCPCLGSRLTGSSPLDHAARFSPTSGACTSSTARMSAEVWRAGSRRVVSSCGLDRLGQRHLRDQGGTGRETRLQLRSASSPRPLQRRAVGIRPIRCREMTIWLQFRDCARTVLVHWQPPAARARFARTRSVERMRAGSIGACLDGGAIV